MTEIPESIKSRMIIPSLERFLYHQGKVRDIYEILEYPDSLLFVASDRVSIYDIVLWTQIPDKGAVLTALTHFWLTTVLKGFPNHLAPSRENPELNAVHDLKETFSGIPVERSLAVKKLKLPPYEMIFRRHLGGSVFRQYQETGEVWGRKFPSNLPRWSYLDEPLFTPALRSSKGHDINISPDDFLEQMGERGRKAMEMFRKAYLCAYEYARAKGFLILDTKFEGDEVIADEVLTPDSSRFTTVEDWEKAVKERRDPIFFDKQVVRDWGDTAETPLGKGINSLDPENVDHIGFIHQLKVPQEVVLETTKRYRQIFEGLTGWKLEDYQQKFMGVG